MRFQQLTKRYADQCELYELKIKVKFSNVIEMKVVIGTIYVVNYLLTCCLGSTPTPVFSKVNNLHNDIYN